MLFHLAPITPAHTDPVDPITDHRSTKGPPFSSNNLPINHITQHLLGEEQAHAAPENAGTSGPDNRC